VALPDGVRLADLTQDSHEQLEGAARLLRESFRDWNGAWQDPESARDTVRESLGGDRISRVAIHHADGVIGWIAGIPSYDGAVWELHPLAVAASHRRRGIGRALVQDLERLARQRGGLTLWLGSDDELGETSVGGVDVYADIPGAIRNFRKLAGGHPAGFYFRLGFRIVGLMPDANGPGQPDIFFAKRLT
jgi:aminoglycoside 6'-N-acetyltransferase I